MITSILFIIISILFNIVVVNKVIKKRFFEKESFFWLIGSFVILILAVFPNTIIVLSHFVGIEYPPSLLFLVASVFMLYLLFRQTQQISLLKEQTKELAEKLAVLEKIEKEKNKAD